MNDMTLDEVSEGFSAFSAPSRLLIFLQLVKFGDEGQTHKDLQSFSNIPSSTLTHHLRILCNSHVVGFQKKSRSTVYKVNFEAVEALTAYLTKNCCEYSKQPINTESEK